MKKQSYQPSPKKSKADLLNEFYCAIEKDQSESAIDAVEEKLRNQGFSVREVTEARYQAWASYSKHTF